MIVGHAFDTRLPGRTRHVDSHTWSTMEVDLMVKEPRPPTPHLKSSPRRPHSQNRYVTFADLEKAQRT